MTRSTRWRAGDPVLCSCGVVPQRGVVQSARGGVLVVTIEDSTAHECASYGPAAPRRGPVQGEPRRVITIREADWQRLRGRAREERVPMTRIIDWIMDGSP